MIKTLDEFAQRAVKFILGGMPPMAFEFAFEGINFFTKEGARIAAERIYKERDRKEIRDWLKFTKTNKLVKDFKHLHKELTELAGER